MAKAVKVVIVNWNGKKFLSECLDALRAQSYAHFSTILVDNGSVDGSTDFVRENYPEVAIIGLEKNLGFSVANNIAIRAVNNPYVALLNNDAVAHPLWLESLVNALDGHPQAGFAASKMLFYSDRNKIDRAGDAYTTAGAALLRGRGMPVTDCSEQEWVFGACAGAALYSTRMLSEIGLFDEDFFLVYEDVDLSFRAQLKGYKCIYVPDAIVYHNTSSSIVSDSPLAVYYGHRNLEWVYIQDMPKSLILKTIWPHIIYNMAAFSYFATHGRLREFTKAKLDALKGLKVAMLKRRRVQAAKKVADSYIWTLFEKELFLPRLSGRSRHR